MNEVRKVLCVLLEDQRKEYEAEFASLKARGAELIFETSPEDALASIGQLGPDLVIVGMDVGSMEGIEFLALLTHRQPEYRGSVVVLPAKSDGLAPLIHARDGDSGRSSVENVGFDQIAELIAGPRPQPAEVYESPVLEEIPEEEALQAPSGKPRWPIPLAAACGVLVIALAGYFVLSGFGETTPATAGLLEPRDASAEPPELAKAEPTPAPPAADTQEPAPAQEVAKAAPSTGEASQEDAESSPAEPAAPPPVQADPALQDDTVLPLAFDSASSRPSISDPHELDRIVEALRGQPGLKIELTGHTSAPGETSSNYRLGMLRARMAQKLLVRRGITRARFAIRSLGEKVPLASNLTPEGRERNRRVTVRLVP
ncbi:MAG: OmpA family protein [Deltaproteobacteria bacterium]|nr:OmpA family protein [Deltaproteobacteria bacterium]